MLNLITSAVKEAGLAAIKETVATKLSPLQSYMEAIKYTSLENLKLQIDSLSESLNQIKESESVSQTESKEGDSNTENKGLSEEEKQQIKDETGWSDEIIDAIGSMEEYRIYRDAELQEVEINSRKCLIRNDIDWEQKDSMLRTNKERAEAGLSPINKDGDIIELHHIGQKNNGSLAELTPDEHRGKENYSVLHDTRKESEIDRVAFNEERSNHWKERAGKGVQNA